LRGGFAGEAFNFSPESRYRVLDIVEAIGTAMNVVTKPEILNTATMEIRDQTLDASKARAQLGWTPAWSLADGLAETVTWYREHLAAATAKSGR
jgi:nucleoside-diphosphate-sugar epimerase